MSERLVLKNYAQRTSQHVKWTAGGRLTITVDRSIDLAVARSKRSLDRSDARTRGRSIARSLDHSIVPSLDRLDGVSPQRFHPQLVARASDRSITRQIHDSISPQICKYVIMCIHISGWFILQDDQHDHLGGLRIILDTSMKPMCFMFVCLFVLLSLPHRNS